MKKDHTPWEYQKGFSFLHRLPGGWKLIFLFAFSSGAFLSGIVVLPFLALLLIVLALSAGIKPWELLRGSLPLIIFVFAVFAFGCFDFSFDGGRLQFSFSPEGLSEGLIFSLRIALSFSTGALFFRVCTMREIKNALGRAESFFHLENLRIGLALSLMLSFLPRFFAMWEDLDEAWESRAGGGGLSKIVKILPVMIEKVMQKAAETAEALEARGAV